jgi:apolipoprotein N-acyltransferase
MSQEIDNILRKSLDDVDRVRKRQTVGFVILFCVMISLFYWFGHMCENPATDLRKIMYYAVFVLFFGMVYVAMAIAMVQSKMTLKILKAIELLSKQ